MILVPFAVPAPLASRHNPDCTAVMVPLALTVHCWPAWLLQSQITTAVPLPVPPLPAARHLLPYTCNCLPEVYVKRWLVPPWQSHNCACAPLAVLAPLMSRHRPDWPPTIVPPC